MTNPDTQSPNPEPRSANETIRPEWTPPQLDKLPVADTSFSGAGSTPDGIDFSS
jgi:hypothetical protein